MRSYTKFFFILVVLTSFSFKGVAMEPRINIVTLGVKDVSHSKKFYQDLGWKASSISNDDFVAFDSGNIILCLYPKEKLAEDAHVEPAKEGFSGVTLAHNVASKAEVDAVLKQAQAAGAKITKNAQDVFWGGYSGYFADPDGHLWEVAFNPHWPLNIEGMLELPK